MTATSETKYIPGVCNINLEEIAYRRKAMRVGFGVAAVAFVAMFLLGLPVIVRAVITFFPLFVGVIGYFQVKNQFCVSYGASGKQNTATGSAQASDVANEADRKKDAAKARNMNLKALVISLVVCGLSVLIPASL